VIQATEVIKLITAIGKPLVGRLLLYDALDASFDEVRVDRSPECPACGNEPSIKELEEYEAFCGVTTEGGSELCEGLGTD